MNSPYATVSGFFWSKLLWHYTTWCTKHIGRKESNTTTGSSFIIFIFHFSVRGPPFYASALSILNLMEFLFLYVVNHCFQLVRKFVSNCTRLHDVIKIKINKKLRDSAKIRAHAEKFWSKTHKKLPQFRRALINNWTINIIL